MSNYGRSYRRRHEPFLDGLPEQMHYSDTGCEVSMSCLECPLPQCKFDDPAWYQAYKRQGRDMEVVWAYKEERLSVFQVARRFGVSPRTVHRAIRRSERGPLAVRVA
jgi:hypothetical protein